MSIRYCGAEPQDGARDIGERHEVAARADRAELADVRRDAGVEEGLEALRAPQAAAPRCRACSELARSSIEARTSAVVSRAPVDALRLPMTLACSSATWSLGTSVVGHAAEQCRHAIDLFAALHRAVEVVDRFVDASDDFRLVGELHLGALGDGGDVGDGQSFAADGDHGSRLNAAVGLTRPALTGTIGATRWHCKQAAAPKEVQTAAAVRRLSASRCAIASRQPKP